MIDVAGAGQLAGQDQGQAREPARVAVGQGAAAVVHRVEPAQEHAADRRLDVVEAQVEADLGVDVLVEPPVIAQAPAARGDVVVVGDEQAAVAHHGEVLRRVEGEAAGAPEAADRARRCQAAPCAWAQSSRSQRLRAPQSSRTPVRSAGWP